MTFDISLTSRESSGVADFDGATTQRPASSNQIIQKDTHNGE